MERFLVFVVTARGAIELGLPDGSHTDLPEHVPDSLDCLFSREAAHRTFGGRGIAYTLCAAGSVR